VEDDAALDFVPRFGDVFVEKARDAVDAAVGDPTTRPHRVPTAFAIFPAGFFGEFFGRVLRLSVPQMPLERLGAADESQ
jgi:hypothetical protein